MGLGATSSIKGKRFSRPRQMADYIAWVQKEDETSKNNSLYTPSWLSTSEEFIDSKEDRIDGIMDTIMTRLRTSEGLDMKWISQLDKDYDYGLYDKILQGAKLGIDLGLMDRTKNDAQDMLTLKDPDGFLFSNTIISSIFVELM